MDVGPSLKEITVVNEGVIKTTVITARSLFLHRFLQQSRAGGRAGGTDLYTWRDDTYIGMLGLTPQMLAGWRGKSVLDVGSGMSFFGTEARVLDIQVTRIDLKVANESVRDSGALDAYLHNMAHFDDNVGEFTDIMNRIMANQRQIERWYEADVMATRLGDATNLLTLPTNSFSVSISIWMLAYLTDVQQASVLREMIRVTRAGGQVRIHSGDTPRRFSQFSFRQQFESARRWDATDLQKPKWRNTSASEFVIADKSVTINQQSGTPQNLLVLDVGAYDPYGLYSTGERLKLKSAVAGKRCSECLAVHAGTVSVVNHWHRCTACDKLYCPTCGKGLTGKEAWHQRERNCRCGGRTELV